MHCFVSPLGTCGEISDLTDNSPQLSDKTDNSPQFSDKTDKLGQLYCFVKEFILLSQ